MFPQQRRKAAGTDPAAFRDLAPQVVPIHRDYLQSRAIGINSRGIRSQQMRANPFGRLHSLDLPFPVHGGTAGTVGLRPNEFPRSVFSREVPLKAIGSIVILYTLGNVLGLTDVKLATWIFQHVHPEHKQDWLRR